MTAAVARHEAGRRMAIRGAAMSWIVESVGFFGYVAWNLLMAVIFLLIVMVLTPRRALA